jgi:Flp pilus assembly protein protease CpaA
MSWNVGRLNTKGEQSSYSKTEKFTACGLCLHVLLSPLKHHIIRAILVDMKPAFVTLIFKFVLYFFFRIGSTVS